LIITLAKRREKILKGYRISRKTTTKRKMERGEKTVETESSIPKRRSREILKTGKGGERRQILVAATRTRGAVEDNAKGSAESEGPLG